MQEERKDLINNKPVLSSLLIWVMAAACGITVANIYYIQPLLGEIAHSFNVTQVSAGFMATLTQVGYAMGLMFVLPFADIVEKRRLITFMLLFSTCSLLLMFFSPNITIALIAAFLTGFTSVVPQLIIPLAAQLSNPKERGKVIGTVMGGLLIGILLSRVVSGFLGRYLEWKTVYLIASGLMIILLFILRSILPVCPPVSNIKYRQSLNSMISLIKKFTVLREASVNGAMVFGAFSAFWTSLTFLLESPHYNMGSDAAGLFGLVGVAGALAAPLAGRISDRRSPKFTAGISLIVIIASYLCLWGFGFKLWGLIIGVILLDLGVQSCNVSNQSRIQQLSEEARNRITAVYMVSFFIGGAAGSFLSSYSYTHFGWYGVCAFGLLTQVTAVAVHMSNRK